MLYKNVFKQMSDMYFVEDGVGRDTDTQVISHNFFWFIDISLSLPLALLSARISEKRVGVQSPNNKHIASYDGLKVKLSWTKMINKNLCGKDWYEVKWEQV